MSSTFFSENLNASALTTLTGDATLGADLIFDKTTADLTITVADQASGAATVTIPDLGGVADQYLAPLLAAGTADKVIRMNGTTGIQEAANVKLLGSDIFTEVVGVSAPSSSDLTLTIDSTQNVIVAGGGLTVAEDLAVSGSAVITGDLTVNGTTTSVNSENVTIKDNNLILSSNYTMNTARQGGLTVNYFPTAITQSVIAAGFTSTTEVSVTDATVFTVGDIILVSGADTPENNGLFEVLMGLTTVVTIATPAASQNYLQSAFSAVADPGAVGSVTKVSVAVLQAGTSGDFQVASGSTAPLTFTDIATSSNSDWTEVDLNQAGVGLTTIATIPLPTLRAGVLEVVFCGRNTLGTGVNSGKMIRSFENLVATVVPNGDGTKDLSTRGIGTAWAVTTAVSGGDILIQVVGGAGTTHWRIIYRLTESATP